MKISLYECFNAKVSKRKIYCVKGHHLGGTPTGTKNILALKRGEPLICETCQDCQDYEHIGEHISPEDRGW